jgi:hypothetical protein
MLAVACASEQWTVLDENAQCARYDQVKGLCLSYAIKYSGKTDRSGNDKEQSGRQPARKKATKNQRSKEECYNKGAKRICTASAQRCDGSLLTLTPEFD